MEVRGVRVEVVEEAVEVAGRTLAIVRPRAPDELLDEEAFEREELLPYWAELWPSAVELAAVVAARELGGRRVVELGCGLGLPSIAAALAGAEVLATDWSPDAIRFARLNAGRNGAALETLEIDWSAPEALLARAPFDLVLAADVLYEGRNVDALLPLLPRLAPEVLLGDPGRPAEARFLAAAAADWTITTAGRVHRLAAPGRAPAPAGAGRRRPRAAP